MTRYPQSARHRFINTKQKMTVTGKHKAGRNHCLLSLLRDLPFRHTSFPMLSRSPRVPSKLVSPRVNLERTDTSHSERETNVNTTITIQKGNAPHRLPACLVHHPSSHPYRWIVGITFDHFRRQIRRRSDFGFGNGLPDLALLNNSGMVGEHRSHRELLHLTLEYPKSQIFSKGRMLPSSNVFSSLMSLLATLMRWQ